MTILFATGPVLEYIFGVYYGKYKPLSQGRSMKKVLNDIRFSGQQSPV